MMLEYLLEHLGIIDLTGPNDTSPDSLSLRLEATSGCRFRGLLGSLSCRLLALVGIVVHDLLRVMNITFL